MWKKELSEEKGSVMVMVLIGLLVLIGFTGLVIDGGSLYLTKSRLQNAADAAALAGAQDLPTGGTAANTAVVYAGKDGMKPLTPDISSSGNTYTASRLADTVQIEIIPAEWGGPTTQPAYTPEQLTQMRSDLTVELGTADNSVLLGYADLYGVTAGMTTVPAHTAAEIAAKRTELETILNGMSDAALIAEAQANTVTTGLGQNPTAAQIDAQIATLTTNLNGMTDTQVIAYASTNHFDIADYTQNANKFKKPEATNRSNAITKIISDRRTQLQGSVVIVISNKSALVAALLDIQVNAFASETVSTINDRPGLITAVVDALIADYANDTVDVQTGHTDRIRVTCSRTVQNSFMAVLGFPSQTVSATAVAEKADQWNGEGLPFINVDPFDIDGETFDTWDKTSSGFFSCIHSADFTIVGTPPNEVFKVDWADGIIPKNGVVSNKQDELEDMWNRLAHGTVYVFSLSPEVIDRGWVEFKNNEIKNIEDINNIPNNGDDGWNLKPGQIILLECTWDGFSHKDIDLTYTGTWYSLQDGDIPLTNEMYSSGDTKLIE